MSPAIFSLILTIIPYSMGMADTEFPATDRPTDLRHDDETDAGAQVDASALALAAVFGAVSFPPDMPDHIKEVVLRRADEARELAGSTVIDSKIDPRQRDPDEERDAALDQWSQMIAQQQREAANEAAWLASAHTYAGQTLSGEEWKRMHDWFGNADNVAEWEDAMMADTGQSRAEVRHTSGKMKRFYDLMDKDAKGALTGDERTEFERLNNDREVRRGVSIQQDTLRLQQSRAAGMSVANENNLDAVLQQRAASFASTFADEPPASKGTPLPELTAVYCEAANGKPMPLSPETPASPGLPRAQTVQVSPDNMFG